MMPSADDQLRTLATQLATRGQVIEALSERLSKQAADPHGYAGTLDAIQRSKAYRFAVILSHMATPLRLAKRSIRWGLSVARAIMPTRRRSPGENPGGELRVRLDRPAPPSAAVGGGNVLMFSGYCYHTADRITALRVTRDGELLDTPVRRYTRPDVFAAHNPLLDPAGHSVDSGFFFAVELTPCDRESDAMFGLEARMTDGSVHRADLDRVAILPTVDPAGHAPEVPPTMPGDPLVAICMATYNPPANLFAKQVDSILAQTHTNWICIITDDGSSPEVFERIEALADMDSRFRVYRNPKRLGFYHNFERCMALVPTEAEYIAFSDHDDEWRPEKLAALLAEFDAETTLVFSDMRIVSATGECVSESYWTTRENNFTDLTSLLIANTVTGAASMFHRRLLSYVLPFPVRNGDVYHDHWIACAALALGKIGYVARPLYDYVQHGRNVIGHCAPPTEGRWRRLSRMAENFWTMENWERWVTNHCRNNYQRFAMTRQFARLLLARCDADLVPGTRKPLWRLARAESSWFSWAWLAIRGMSRRRVTLGYEYALIASVWWRMLSGSLTGRRRPRLVTQPPAINVHDRIAPPTVPLTLLQSQAEPQRVNMLVDTLNLPPTSGASIAILHLANRLAKSGRRVRLVITDWCPFEPATWRDHIQSFPGLETLPAKVELVYAQDRGVPLPVHPDDQFVATNWWTAHIAHRASSDLGRRSFVRVTHEYEPHLYAAGPVAALAGESYSFPHYCVFSTDFLRDFFRQRGLGVYAAGAAAGDRDSVAFANALAPVETVTTTELTGRSPYRFLFHARPEPDNGRTLFDFGILAIAEAIRSGAFPGDWEFSGISSYNLHARVALAEGATMQLLPRKAPAEYAKMLKTYDVGMSLMFSAHPSLVALEMASAGLRTVTNTYFNKTADRLRKISPNLIGVEPTVPALVAGIRRAIAGVGDYEARARGARMSWSTDWSTTFSSSLLHKICEFLDDEDLPASVRMAA